MPKSFLFTHKRYDYDDFGASSQVKVEIVEDEMRDSVPSDTTSSSGSFSSSVSSGGGFSEDEMSPLPKDRYRKMKAYSRFVSAQERERQTSTGSSFQIPKLSSTTITPVPIGIDSEEHPQLSIKEELEDTPMITSNFQSLIVSGSKYSKFMKRHESYEDRGNVIHQLKPHRNIDTSSSYQIKLISPPPGGTLFHPSHLKFPSHRKDDHLKLETMTSSPLQFIIAAAEQQEQAEEKRIFIEGSRSESSQHHSPMYNLHSPPEQDQPVNLSVRKVDLFNLTQLAEVSIAAARREMMGTRSDVSNTSTQGSMNNNASLMTEQSLISNQQDSQPNFHSPSPPLPSDKRIRCKSKTPSDGDGIRSSGENGMGISNDKANWTKTEHISSKSAKRNVASSCADGKLRKKRDSGEEKELRNGKNSGGVLSSSSNCRITSNNSFASASTSSSPSPPVASSPLQRHKCVECGKGFSTLSNLARHRQTHRSLSDASAVKKCPHCDKVYVSMPAFSMHLRTHNQGCKCPYCGKGFSRPWLLQGHIRTHTGEKPFKCGICSKAFADKSNLRAHTQTHSTEKPFACQRCGKLFALKSYLCKHIESSCMKSNRPSGSSGSSSASGSSNVLPTTATSRKQQHHSEAINNSSSGASCSTRGTSPPPSPPPVSSSSSSSASASPSPTNRDIRCASNNATTTVTACYSTTSSRLNDSFPCSPEPSLGSKTPNVASTTTLLFSSRNGSSKKKQVNRPILKTNNNSNEHYSHSKTNSNESLVSASISASFQTSTSTAGERHFERMENTDLVNSVA